MNKLIFISNSLADIEKVTEFAKNSNYLLEYYSQEGWKNNTKKSYNINTVNAPLSIVASPIMDNHQTMDEIKIEAIRNALLKSRGNASKAAEMLQIGRATLYRKIKDLGLSLESIRQYLNEQEYEPEIKKTA